ncbi:RING-H2 finger protein ATL63 [Cajanus cajan]|uniref:RING-type E3 ubiquitin transferase n=1 Tax=Cajanus cajan TaxID=3821 RepID=A0A151RY95_CAJCA|nr:RING-H2 finger protein ATL63 [Cajanus cajan]KYP47536.1 RING-H2 finger protein ATL3F [Cajanus cajan]
MPTQSESPNNKSMSTLTQMFQNIFSDNSNIMLAAIISLLLVILFVLLLHLYAKWFLAQAQAQSRRRRRRRRTTVTVSDVLGPARFHHFHSFNIEDSSPLSTKGLDSSTIRAIPLFIYDHNKKVQEEYEELECVICLSAFEGGEVGRCLPKCGHGFHVECIDMWLSSHSNCPICRASIVVESDSSRVVASSDHGGDDLVEIVVDGGSDEIRESHHENANSNGNGVVNHVSVSGTSSFFGCSLERMLGNK